MSINKNHRTALFINVAADSSSDFRERSARLVESVNGSNIKVDVYSVDPFGNITNGLVFPSAQPEAVAVDVQSLATAAGYTQVLTSSQGA